MSIKRPDSLYDAARLYCLSCFLLALGTVFLIGFAWLINHAIDIVRMGFSQ